MWVYKVVSSEETTVAAKKKFPQFFFEMGLFFHLAESCSSIFRGISSRKATIKNFRYFNNISPISRSPIRSSSSFSTISSPPWLLLPPSFEEKEMGMKYNFYSPAEDKIVSFDKKNQQPDGAESEEVPDDKCQIVGSSHGWLALMNPDNCDLFLSNPITGRHIKLPSIHPLGIPYENLIEGCIDKLIISCDDPHSPECRALMIFGPTSRVAFCFPALCSPLSSISTRWTNLGKRFFDYGCARAYDEFVYDSRRKLFYCLLSFHEIEGWEIINDHRQQPRMDWASHKNLVKDNLPKRSGYTSRTSYLIAFSDQLFLVCREYVPEMAPDGTIVQYCEIDDDYPHKTVGFHVYRIDREGQKLSYLEGSLDGLVMFVGQQGHCFALSASEFPGLNPNSIYFTDLFYQSSFQISAYGGHDIGIFDYESKTLSPCYYPCDVQSFKRIMPPPLWFTPTFST